jgi:hypothetical protein
MDKAKILRLLDEADDIVSALYRQGANKEYKCKSLREKLKAIAAEITAPPKTNADRIRQMTVEELAAFIDIYDIEDICKTRCAKTGEARERCMCYGEQCVNNILQWLKQEVSEDAGSKTD